MAYFKVLPELRLLFWIVGKDCFREKRRRILGDIFLLLPVVYARCLRPSL